MGDGDKECEGCLTYIIIDIKSRKVGCSIPFKYKDILCPCLDCIVKTVCNSTCSAYIKYNKGFYRYMETKAG